MAEVKNTTTSWLFATRQLVGDTRFELVTPCVSKCKSLLCLLKTQYLIVYFIAEKVSDCTGFEKISRKTVANLMMLKSTYKIFLPVKVKGRSNVERYKSKSSISY